MVPSEDLLVKGVVVTSVILKDSSGDSIGGSALMPRNDTKGNGFMLASPEKICNGSSSGGAGDAFLHELAHTYAQQHTNTDAGGCDLAKQFFTRWPYRGTNNLYALDLAGNSLFSAKWKDYPDDVEVGFDVGQMEPVTNADYKFHRYGYSDQIGSRPFEIMSYCDQAWISSYTYVEMMKKMGYKLK